MLPPVPHQPRMSWWMLPPVPHQPKMSWWMNAASTTTSTKEIMANLGRHDECYLMYHINQGNHRWCAIQDTHSGQTCPNGAARAIHSQEVKCRRLWRHTFAAEWSTPPLECGQIGRVLDTPVPYSIHVLDVLACPRLSMEHHHSELLPVPHQTNMPHLSKDFMKSIN